MAALQVSTDCRVLLALGFLSSFFIAISAQSFDNTSCISLAPSDTNLILGSDSSGIIVVPRPTTYIPGQTVTVFVVSATVISIDGFLLQARPANTSDGPPVGSFSTTTSGVGIFECQGGNVGSLIGLNTLLPLTLMWTAPEFPVGDVELIATFIIGGNYWTEPQSSTITGPNPTAPIIHLCPLDTTVNEGDPATWSVPSCISSTAPTSTCTVLSGVVLTATTTVTCTCANILNVEESCSFQVIVVPVVISVLQCPADITRPDGTTIQYTSPECPPDALIPGSFCNPSTSTAFPIGITTVTCMCFTTPTTSCEFSVTVTAILDPCTPNPCQNGGICTAALDTFACRCVGGFNGPTCEDGAFQCPADIRADEGAPVSYIAPDCRPGFVPVIAVCVPDVNALFPVGVSTVTCRCFGATTDTCVFDVTVTDTGPTCVNNPCDGTNVCRESTSSSAGYTCHSTQGTPCL